MLERRLGVFRSEKIDSGLSDSPDTSAYNCVFTSGGSHFSQKNLSYQGFVSGSFCTTLIYFAASSFFPVCPNDCDLEQPCCEKCNPQKMLFHEDPIVLKTMRSVRGRAQERSSPVHIRKNPTRQTAQRAQHFGLAGAEDRRPSVLFALEFDELPGAIGVLHRRMSAIAVHGALWGRDDECPRLRSMER